MIVRKAKLADLPYIIDLSKKESHALGFIPKMAYSSAITGIKTGKRWSNICNDKLFVITENDDLVGFCLASFGKINAGIKLGKIAQICLQEDARLLARGAALLKCVIDYGKTVRTFDWACGCADDLLSNLFWVSMGWVKTGQRKGKSHKNTWMQTSDRLINTYMYAPCDLFISNKSITTERTD